jgi:hypothetical protein
MITYNSLYKYFIVLLIGGYEFSATLSELLSLPEGSSPLVTVARGLTVVTGLALFLFAARSGKVSITKSSIPLLLVMVAYLIRMAIDFEIYNMPSSEGESRQYTFYMLAVFIPVMFMSLAPVTKERLINLGPAIKSTMVYTVVLIALAALIVNGSSTNGESTRLATARVNPISVSSMAGLLVLYIYTNYNNHQTSRLLSVAKLDLVIVSFCLSLMVMTGSKGPFVALILTIGFTELMKSTGVASIAKYIITFSILGGFLYFAVSNLTNFLLFDRLSSVNSDTELSTLSRIMSIQEGLQTFIENPLIGKHAILSTGGYPHNILVELAMAFGVFGIAFAVGLVANIRKSIRHFVVFERKLLWVPVFTLYFFIIHNFSGSIWTASRLFVIYALLLKLCYRYKTSTTLTGRIASSKIQVDRDNAPRPPC